MMQQVIERWHELLDQDQLHLLPDLLSETVLFHSPVVHTPQKGTRITTATLTAAFKVLKNGHFHYTRELIGEYDALLEFETEIDGIFVNGVDIIQCNDEGLIVDFKVMIRPLKAIQAVQESMARQLEVFA